jgi:hypothetical protein
LKACLSPFVECVLEGDFEALFECNPDYAPFLDLAKMKLKVRSRRRVSPEKLAKLQAGLKKFLGEQPDWRPGQPISKKTESLPKSA